MEKTLEEDLVVKDTDRSLMERSAALRTMKRVVSTMSRSLETKPVK